jgi:hypothetical protein
MSVYATFDENPGEQIASNSGWADTCAWMRASGFTDLAHLADEGFVIAPGLVDTLTQALRDSPPDKDVRSVVEGLMELLAANASAEAVFITSGMRR